MEIRRSHCRLGSQAIVDTISDGPDEAPPEIGPRTPWKQGCACPAGGGAQLRKGQQNALTDELNLRVWVAEHPMTVLRPWHGGLSLKT